MTPTARTLAELRKLGYLAGVVEKRNAKLAHVTHDLFGCVDVLGVKGEQCTLCDGYGNTLPLAATGYGERGECSYCERGRVGAQTLAIQATSGDNHASRVEKVRTTRYPPPNKKKGTPGGPLVLPRLKAAGWTVEVWSWRKSAKTKRWTLRREAL